VPLDKRLQLEERMSHLDAEPLGLVRPRNHAPVVVRQNDDGPPVEIGPEHPLTGDEEVVAIGETVHDFDRWLLNFGVQRYINYEYTQTYDNVELLRTTSLHFQRK